MGEEMSQWSIAGALGLTAFFGASLASAQSAQTINPNASIVYIECHSSDGVTGEPGTGVIVSEQGVVLTAAHVAPTDNHTCTGRIRVRSSPTVYNLRILRRHSHYDAITLLIDRTPDETFPAVQPAVLLDTMQGQRISVGGFPYVSEAVQPLWPRGHITNIIPEPRTGLIATDALQATGMSGGPVILEQDGTLIGIVSGARMDVLSAPAAFMVIPYGSIMEDLRIRRDQIMVHADSNAASARIAETAQEDNAAEVDALAASLARQCTRHPIQASPTELRAGTYIAANSERGWLDYTSEELTSFSQESFRVDLRNADFRGARNRLRVICMQGDDACFRDRDPPEASPPPSTLFCEDSSAAFRDLRRIQRLMPPEGSRESQSQAEAPSGQFSGFR